MTILTKEQVEALDDTLSPMERVLNAYQAAPDLHDTCLALFAEVETLRNQAILSRAEGEGLASMLLSVQQDCIAAVKEVGRLREALTDMLQSVCGPTGFAEAVRLNSGLAYPWHSLDLAEAKARAALAQQGRSAA